MSALAPAPARSLLARVLPLVALFASAALPFVQGSSASGQFGGVDASSRGTSSQPSAATAPVDPHAWPRTYSKAGSTIVIHQPQVDAWQNHEQIKFRCAIAVTPAGAKEPTYGVIAVQAQTAVNTEAGTVVMTDLTPAVHFPGLTEQQSQPLQALVLELIPGMTSVQVWLSQVLAAMQHPAQPRTVNVNLDPPPIFVSQSPAIMVNFVGPPQFRPVTGSTLMFAVNTNWAVFMDTSSSRYYLLVGDSWMTAPDAINGPWTPAGTLPTAFSSLPKGNFPDVVENIPGAPFTVVPTVFASTVPAELIVTNGPPDYTPIDGTQLMYVSNPVQPVFADNANGTTYLLAAGRWFSAPSLQGPWAAASAGLPPDFAQIPDSSPVAFVLPSVPGTQEASDAVLLAQVPHKSTINIADVSVTPTYSGTPQFMPITGTSMQYAVNTSYQVINAAGQYYCCHKGVWFVAPTATGPWSVCTSVPSVIYTIPPSSPVYNTTYVQVYNATPTTVTVGYTAGYSGEYVATTGALMFGAGMLTGALIASNNCSECWHCWSPWYCSYGCAAWYHPAYCGYWGGAYYHGGAYYGPRGSASWGASYNAATGVYSRSGYASGPYGAASGHQAYNPWTGGYAAHGSATNGYRSWGGTTVSQGNQWASAGHTTNNMTGVTRGAAADSSGQWVQGAHAGNSTVARTSSGDTYAGHDGNVYRNDNGTWQKYDGSGSWSNTARQPGSGTAAEARPADAGNWQSQASTARNNWNSNWDAQSAHNSWQNSMAQRQTAERSGGWGGWQGAQQRSDVDSGLNRDFESRQSGGWGGGGRSWGGGGFAGRSFGGGARFGGFRR